MSAPTLAAFDPQADPALTIVGGHWATPADVRLWLLDQGATETWFCEEHDSNRASSVDYPPKPGAGDRCQVAEMLWNGAYGDYSFTIQGCRMVSVLVYKSSE